MYGSPRPAVLPSARIEKVMVEDLLEGNGRKARPQNIVVLVRGLPGAGKTYISKLLKDKEMASGGTSVRTLCLDDYFMTEVEKDVMDGGRKSRKTVLEYEYDAEMADTYRHSLLKSYKKQLDNMYFNFLIVDCVFDKARHLEEFWSYGKSKGFQVYVLEVEADISTCVKRNIHDRKEKEIKKLADRWEPTPDHFIRLDARSLEQDAAIPEVEMEMEDDSPPVEPEDKSQDGESQEEEDAENGAYKKSKWEVDASEDKLDRLDGTITKTLKHATMDEYLELSDDYETRALAPGQKRVRWADIEERKSQVRRRELGFVVGQTDWSRMSDDSYASRALNRTKYI